MPNQLTKNQRKIIAQSAGRFLLVCGVSGVGKTALIQMLLTKDSRFTYISPHMTRPLRAGEQDKVAVSAQTFSQQQAQGMYACVNTFNGVSYGTPLQSIIDAFAQNKWPVLDFLIENAQQIKDLVGDKCTVIYLTPPSINILKQRLDKDGRDPTGLRLQAAQTELAAYHQGKYDHLIDSHYVSAEGALDSCEQSIRNIFISGSC